MDFVKGVEWGVRVFLAREPRPEDTALADGVQSAEMLRARLLGCDEITHCFDLVGLSQPDTPKDLDWAEGLRWTYRLALRREASEADIAEHSAGIRSVADLRRVFRSREFEIVSPDAWMLPDLEVLRQFAPFATEPVGAHAFRNFVGAETRLEFLHPSLAWKGGQVEGVTRPSAPGLHGLAEWVGSLRSVLEAQGSLTVMELGAGWAPWLVSCALAAKRRGIEDIRLIGVEGSAEHHNFMRQHFLDNGLNPDAHLLHHAVVGVEDGTAYFPRLVDPVADYGAFAAFDDEDPGAAATRGDLEPVACLSLTSLLEQSGRVDLMHMDIQGHEQAVLAAAMDHVDAKVHRVIVGTHSRTIDGALLELFSSHSWYLEYEKPARVMQGVDNALHYVDDGEQVWVNPRT